MILILSKYETGPFKSTYTYIVCVCVCIQIYKRTERENIHLCMTSDGNFSPILDFEEKT